MAATVQDALDSISSVIQDGSFKQPIGIGSNLAPWADWTAAGITTAAAPAFLSGDYASLPVGADLFQRFSPLANGTYQLSFWVQNTSSAPAHLVFDVQPVGGGVDISQWFSLGLLWDLTLPANSGWTKEIVTFTVNNPPALLSEFSFSNSYDAPIGQLASTINAAGTVINVAEVSILALGQGTGPAIEDSAANVLANLDALGTLASAGRLGSISLTDPGTPELTLTGTQLAIGVAVLERIVGPYEVTAVSSLDAATASSISTTIAAHVGAFAVSDSAASVGAHLDSLQGLLSAGKLTSISLTDGGSPTIVITPSQAAADAPVLQSISSDYRLTISGPVDVATAIGLPTSVLAKLSHALTASDVADPATQFFDSQNGHIYQFIATPALHWTDAEQAATSYVLGGQHGYLATITSANEQAFVQSHIGSTSALSYWLGGVRDANNNWVWTEGPDAGLQFWHGNADGSSIGGAYSNWDLGAAIPQPNQVGENYLNIDAVSYGYGLNPGKWADANNTDNWGSIVEYGGQAAGGLKIADSAANLAAHLDALGAHAAGGAIGSITLTDQTVPILSLSPAQLLADAPLLETIAGNFQLSLSGPIPTTAIGTLPLQLLQKIISPAPTVADASIHGGFVNAATNTAEQSLSGTSEPGSTVTVYLNGANTPSFTATADSNGVWSHLVGALSDGKYSYTATATNAIGTVSAPSASLAFTVDTQAPGTQGPPLSSLITNPSTQFYDAANGHVYEVVNTAVTWTEALNMSATHTLGGVQGHLVTVTSAAENQFVTNLAANYVTTGWDGRSIWLAGSDAQQEGVWRWMAGPETGAQFWQGDGSGHAIGAFSPPWYPNQPSDPNGSSGMSGTWSNPLGTGADYLFLDAYYPGSIWADVYSSTTAVSTPSSPIASSEGVRNAYIIEYEPQAAVPLTVSNVAIVNGYVNGIHNTGAQALNGLAEPGSTVSVFLNGATIPAFTATADPTGAWSHTVGVLADGSYSYVATATDAAGNVSLPTAPLAFTVKTLTTESPITDAAVTIGSDGAAYLNAANCNGGTTTLSGKAEAGDTVTVSDGTHVTTATVASDGSWTAAISGLLNGQSYSYTATATDIAGNTATSAPFAFTVKTDTTESSIADSAVTIGSDGVAYLNAAHVNGGTTTLSGKAEAGDKVTVSDGTHVTSAAVANDGTWTAVISGLVNGQTYTYTATATDAAGNSETSASFAFTVNAQAAVVTIDNGALLVTQNQQTISGTVKAAIGEAVAGGTVSILEKGVQIGTATVNPNGTWSTQVTLSGDGFHNLTATNTDVAGNTGISPSTTLLLQSSPVFRPWAQELAPYFHTQDSTYAGQPIAGQHWDRSQTAGGFGLSGGLWVDTATPQAGYAVNTSNPYTIYVTAHAEQGGQHDGAIAVATANMVYPFPNGGASYAALYARSGNIETGGVFWWDAGASTGSYDLKYQALTLDLSKLSPTSSTQAISLVGSVVTLLSGVPITQSNLFGLSYNTDNQHLLFGYSLPGTVGGTKDIYLQGFDIYGTAVSPLTKVANGIASNLSWEVFTNGGQLYYAQADQSNPSNAMVDIQTINPATMTRGPTLAIPTGFTTLYSFDPRFAPSDNSQFLSVVEGLKNGAHTLGVQLFDTSGNAIGSGTQFAITQPSSIFWQLRPTTTSGGDVWILSYTDNNVVHLELFNAHGQQIGSDYTPGLTSFDRLRVLGDGIFEIDYRANGGNPQGLIYDVSATPDLFINSPGITTDQATQTVFGHTDVTNAGQTVLLYAGGNGTPIGSAVVDNGGDWTARVTLPSDGAYPVVAKLTSPSSQVLTSPAVTYTLDTTNPTVFINAPNAYVNSGAQTITGTVLSAAGNGVLYGRAVTITDQITNTVIGTGMVGPNGQWAAPVTLAGDGQHNLIAMVADQIGHVGTSNAASLYLDVDPPALRVTSTGGLVNKVTQTITGQIDEFGPEDVGATVRLYVDNSLIPFATAIVGATGTWSAQVAFAGQGQHSVYAQVVDAAGNTATSAPFAFTVKTSTFESAITDAAVTGGYLNGAHFNGGSTTLSGKAEAGDTVTVSDGTHATVATVASDGSWTAVISGLGNGQRYSYTATALDAAGNTATSQPFAFTVKTSTSESAITDAAVIGGFINAAHFNAGTTTLSGKAEAGDTVIVSDGTHVTAATVATDGSWTAAISGLLNGQTYSYTATATDLAGNTATSAPFGFKVDTQPPSPTISTAGGEAIYPAVIISGTGEAGTLVQLYDGLTKIGAPVAVSGNGSWTETVTLVGTGSHAISALDTDAAGNTGKSASIVFSLDNQIVGNTNQSIISGTSANDHITVVPNNLIVNAGGGNDTITLTSGPSTQVHIVDGGAGTNTLDLSQISSAVTVDLKLGVASGSQVGTVLLSSIQNVVAGGGAETIVGSSGANVFQAGSGMDRITGGGGADTFVFRPGFGNTTVTDFKVSGASHGTIEIDHSIFATWAALDAALADSKQGAVITVNAAESITLNGVTKAQLEANHLADFHFI